MNETITEEIGYDIIGDIHGCAQELRALLEVLGYEKTGEQGVYRHPRRIAVFVGDLIDRGPGIREVLQIVKGMHDAGWALCIKGNHEWNAYCFWTQRNHKGGSSCPYLREHSHKNICQHYATIKAFQNYQQEWFEIYLPWLRDLPIYLDISIPGIQGVGFRVVHALWTDQVLQTQWSRDQEFCEPPPELQMVLKGEKIDLPQGIRYLDKDGNERRAGRVKWWLDCHAPGMTYADYLEDGVMNDHIRNQLARIPIPQTVPRRGYDQDQRPVFFGHYWLRGEPKLQTPNACCLDYSCAKGDKLLCYRWDGEQTLDSGKFVWVDSTLRQERK